MERNEDKPHCERCGAILPTLESVCEKCDRELSASGLDPTRGRHICPKCGSRFDAPVLVKYPENVAWYRPQLRHPQCPHCSCLLLDRAKLSVTSRTAVVLGAGVAVHLFMPGRMQVFLPHVAFAALAAAAWHKTRSIPTEYRYALREP